MSIDVNYLAVIVAAVMNMIIGYIWYGPAFGKTWMRLANIIPQNLSKEEQSKMMKKSMSIMFVGALVMAYVFFHLIKYGATFTNTVGAASGLSLGFWIWLGFIAPIMLGKVLWEGKSWKLWTLESGYYLVMLLVNGAILGAWM